MIIELWVNSKSNAMKKLIYLVLIGLCVSCSDDNEKKESEAVTTEPLEIGEVSDFSTGSLTEPIERFFSFETGEEVPASEANTKNWDISFKRAEIRLNGGVSGPGAGAVVKLPQTFSQVTMAPDEGYVEDGDGPTSDIGTQDGLAMNDWFLFENSTVTPVAQTYVIRTAKGKYAKLEILSYYGSGGQSAFYSFRYGYQPGGSKVLE